MKYVLALCVIVLLTMPAIAAKTCPGGKCPVPSMVAPPVAVHVAVAPLAKAVTAPRRLVARVVAKKPVRSAVKSIVSRRPGKRLLGAFRSKRPVRRMLGAIRPFGRCR